MNFTETRLAGAYVVDILANHDMRGFFARTFCRDDFVRHGLSAEFAQCSTSFTRWRGTLRGMHYQADPHPETKLVRCTRGAVRDVIIDLRRGSRTYCHWIAVDLTDENVRALYVPAGFAHGFQTLTDNSEVLYQISEAYRAELARGVRWNDPAFCIDWPIRDPILSIRDATYPDFAVSAAS
jgi:dTDP-4-dehydrorhamnose 3,5-epimerase